MATQNARYMHLRGTASEHANANLVLLDGEIAVESDTGFFKIGDGVTAWNSLPYVTSAAIPWATLSELKAGVASQKAIDAVVGAGYLIREPSFSGAQVIAGDVSLSGLVEVVQAPRAGSTGNTDAANKLAVQNEIVANLAANVGVGSGDADKAPILGATGRLDQTFLPTNLSSLDYRGVFDPTDSDGDGGNGSLALEDTSGGGLTPSAANGSYVIVSVDGFWDLDTGTTDAGPAGGTVVECLVTDQFIFSTANDAWGRVLGSSAASAAYLQVSGANTMDGDFSFSTGTRTLKFQGGSATVQGESDSNLADLLYFDIDCGSY